MTLVDRVQELLNDLDAMSVDSTRAPDARRMFASEANELRAVLGSYKPHLATEEPSSLQARYEEALRVKKMWNNY